MTTLLVMYRHHEDTKQNQDNYQCAELVECVPFWNSGKMRTNDRTF